MGVTLSRRTRRSRVGHIQIGKRRCVPQSKSLGRKSLQLQVFPAEISTCGLQAAESRLAAKVSALVLPKAPRAWLPRMNCATRIKLQSSVKRTKRTRIGTQRTILVVSRLRSAKEERKGGVKEAKVARKVVARQGTEQRQVQAKLQHLAMARMALSRARASLHWLPPKRPRAPRAKRIAQVKAKRSRVIVCGSIFDI